MGYQNTLNQIGTHYELGNNPTNFETTTQSKFKDTSETRDKPFNARNVQEYKGKSHFNFGKEGTPMMTSTWTHFSRKFVEAK